MDWVAFSAAMVVIIGALGSAIGTATVAIINAIHAARLDQSSQHIENTKTLASIEAKVNGNTEAARDTLNRVIDKLPSAGPPSSQ